MIPATRPYSAKFKHDCSEGKPWVTYLSVVAWDDEGRALVVDERTGRLIPADAIRDFAGVGPDEPRYIAALPAVGWRAAWKNEGGTEDVWPLLGWAIDERGYGIPLDADSDNGFVGPITVADDKRLRFLPPGEDAATVADRDRGDHH